MAQLAAWICALLLAVSLGFTWGSNFDLRGQIDWTAVGAVTGAIVAVIALLPIFLEWKRRHDRRLRLKNALETELGDIHAWMQRGRLTLEKSLMHIVHGEPWGGIPIPLPTRVFDAYYTEIVSDLTRDERISYTSIYSIVEVVNGQFDLLRQLYLDAAQDPEKLSRYAEVVEGAYVNAWNASWQAGWHLSRAPALEMDEMRDEWAEKLNQRIHRGLRAVESKARSITLDEVRAYPEAALRQEWPDGPE